MGTIWPFKHTLQAECNLRKSRECFPSWRKKKPNTDIDESDTELEVISKTDLKTAFHPLKDLLRVCIMFALIMKLSAQAVGVSRAEKKAAILFWKFVHVHGG